ncbi:site-specific integrase [Paenibacillus mesophilus]|uniref:tyrosine-type recombinase/integrase n=1 Tax=Paenibacillus mesophilus TaxID=2582849 RepID=UPI00110E22C2|nr:site-specific integrase [Paenibacillus mesophilus]TMV52631.1 site-specific integrase [Paenibacillus mesophilus]
MNILLNSNYYKMWEQHCTLREKTKQNYISSLRKLEEFLLSKGYSGNLDFNKFIYYQDVDKYSPINQIYIDSFIEFLKDKGCTDYALSTSISALKSFFKLLKSLKLIDRNPVQYYKNPYHNIKYKDKSLSEEECTLLLEAALKLDPFTRQYYIIILLLLNTGLRNKELRELTISQIDLDRQIIYVERGTKTKANTVMLSQKLCEELKFFLSRPFHEEWQKSGSEHVFFLKKRTLNRNSLNKILREVSNKAGVRPITCHWLRYTMAYMMQLAGVDISVIQRQLRHRDLKTTLHYLSQFADGFEY